MPTTPRLLLPYPTPDDNPDLPAQMQALADRLDSVVAIPYAGDLKFSARTGEHGAWIKADGRVLAAGQYTPLRDALIADGSPYGSSSGNPKLPDLRGRTPVGAGTGAGLTARANGQAGGEERHALTLGEAPNHRHYHWAQTANRAGFVTAVAPSEGDLNTNTGEQAGPGPTMSYYNAPNLTMSGDMSPSTRAGELYKVTSSGVVPVGDGSTHENMPPYAVGTWFVYGG